MRFRLPRFSLLTLLFFAIAIGAGMGLYMHWEPWVLVKTEVVLVQEFKEHRHIVFYREGTPFKLWKRGEKDFAVLENEKEICTLEYVEGMSNSSYYMDSKIIYGSTNYKTSGGNDFLWDTRTGKFISRLDNTKEDAVYLYFKPHMVKPMVLLENNGKPAKLFHGLYGAHIGVIAQDGSVRIHSLLNDALNMIIKHDGLEFCDVRFSDDHSKALLFSKDRRKGQIVDLNSKQITEVFELPGSEPLFPITFYRCPSSCFALQNAHESKNQHVYLISKESGREVCSLDHMETIIDRALKIQTSLDEERVILFNNYDGQNIWDAHTGKRVAYIPNIRQAEFDLTEHENMTLVGLAPNSTTCKVYYQRRRPEYWWGIAWLPEFWVLLAALAGLSVQAVRARRSQPA